MLSCIADYPAVNCCLLRTAFGSHMILALTVMDKTADYDDSWVTMPPCLCTVSVSVSFASEGLKELEELLSLL